MSDTTTIFIAENAGVFAENKDVARELRLKEIEPALHAGLIVRLDFVDVSSVTQSFAHALISQTIRDFGIDVLDRIEFSHCNDTVKQIITIVSDYMQRSDEG